VRLPHLIDAALTRIRARGVARFRARFESYSGSRRPCARRRNSELALERHRPGPSSAPTSPRNSAHEDTMNAPIKLRSDGRPHDTGEVKPYRPCPADFREVFLRLGQSPELREHYRTNDRIIRRWIKESGGDELRAERYRITGCGPKPWLRSENRARRYVLGRTLGPRE
jgi:hypothetical protein